MEKILVVGANGTTGKKIVQLLNSSQYFEPVAMVRKESQENQFKIQKISTVIGDLEEEVGHTLKNIDKVIFVAGSGGKKVIEVDQEGAKKIIDAAKKNTVTKFIMLSSMGADNPEKNSELQEYLKAKYNADKYLKASKLKYAIVRPGTLNNNPGNGKITLAKSLNEQGEITRDDVAQTLVKALHDDTANNVIFEIIQGDTIIGKALDATE